VPPNPENRDFYSDHTQPANYGGGYYDSEPPEPPTPWYRRPLALIVAGVAGAGLLALLVAGVYLLLSKPGQEPTPAPATTPSVTPTTTAPAETPRRHEPSGGGEPTQTVTETPPASSTDTPTTTVPPSTVTMSPSTETSTVTQTVTVPTRRPFGR
jgi:hypothetical protein